MAVHIPSTRNPSISLPANRIIIAFTTKRNKPSVRMVTGNVKMTKTGLTSTFRIANTTATIKAPT